MKKKKIINLAIDPSVIQDNIPAAVIDRLYIGSLHSALNLEGLTANGITHIINASRLPATFPRTFTYLHIDIRDRVNANILSVIPATNIFIEAGLEAGGVLVHCMGGRSRSTALIAAYLLSSLRLPFDTVYEMIRAARPVADLNVGFENQLRAYSLSNCNIYIAQQVLLRNRIRALKHHQMRFQLQHTASNRINTSTSPLKLLHRNSSSSSSVYPEDKILRSNSQTNGTTYQSKYKNDRMTTDPGEEVDEEKDDQCHGILLPPISNRHQHNATKHHSFDRSATTIPPVLSSSQSSYQSLLLSSSLTDALNPDPDTPPPPNGFHESGAKSFKASEKTSTFRKETPLLEDAPTVRLHRPGTASVRVIPPARGLERAYCCNWCSTQLFNLANVIRLNRTAIDILEHQLVAEAKKKNSSSNSSSNNSSSSSSSSKSSSSSSLHASNDRVTLVESESTSMILDEDQMNDDDPDDEDNNNRSHHRNNYHSSAIHSLGPRSSSSNSGIDSSGGGGTHYGRERYLSPRKALPNPFKTPRADDDDDDDDDEYKVPRPIVSKSRNNVSSISSTNSTSRGVPSVTQPTAPNNLQRLPSRSYEDSNTDNTMDFAIPPPRHGNRPPVHLFHEANRHNLSSYDGNASNSRIQSTSTTRSNSNNTMADDFSLPALGSTRMVMPPPSSRHRQAKQFFDDDTDSSGSSPGFSSSFSSAPCSIPTLLSMRSSSRKDLTMNEDFSTDMMMTDSTAPPSVSSGGLLPLSPVPQRAESAMSVETTPTIDYKVDDMFPLSPIKSNHPNSGNSSCSSNNGHYNSNNENNINSNVLIKSNSSPIVIAPLKLQRLPNFQNHSNNDSYTNTSVSTIAPSSVSDQSFSSTSGGGIQQYVGDDDSPRIPIPPERDSGRSRPPPSVEKKRWLDRVSLLKKEGDSKVCQLAKEDDDATFVIENNSKYYHVEYLDWMGDGPLTLGADEGPILCYNCKKVIGSWFWNPSPRHLHNNTLEAPLFRICTRSVRELAMDLDATPRSTTPRADHDHEDSEEEEVSGGLRK